MAALHATLAYVALGILAQPQVDEAPTPEQVRQAVKRSLPYIEKEGVAWMKNRQCSSCHQVPMMVWTLDAARRGGISVDAEKLNTWTEWTAHDALNRNTFFKLTDAAAPKLREAGMAEADVAKLQPVKNRQFVLSYEYHEELAKAATEPVVAPHKDLLLKSAAIPGQGGRGGSASSSGYTAVLLASTLYGSRIPEATRQALLDGLVKSQPKDGIWKTAGQFLAQKWPAAEAHEAHTMWTLHALASIDKLPEPVAAARTRALAALKNAKPGVSTETLVLQLLLAHHQADAERSRTLLQQLLQQQHADGGWGWVKDKAESDAYATGQVLYALGVIGRKGPDVNVQRAWKYLLASQRPDGVWPVPRVTISAPVKKSNEEGDAVYTYWGTGWALLGLLGTLPD